MLSPSWNEHNVGCTTIVTATLEHLDSSMPSVWLHFAGGRNLQRPACALRERLLDDQGTAHCAREEDCTDLKGCLQLQVGSPYTHLLVHLVDHPLTHAAQNAVCIAHTPLLCSTPCALPHHACHNVPSHPDHSHCLPF